MTIPRSLTWQLLLAILLSPFPAAAEIKVQMHFSRECASLFQRQGYSGYVFQIQDWEGGKKTCRIRARATRKNDGTPVPDLLFRLVESPRSPVTNLAAAPVRTVGKGRTDRRGVVRFPFRLRPTACWYFLRGQNFTNFPSEKIIATKFQLDHPFECDCAGNGCT
jgi:hypothetical protein